MRDQNFYFIPSNVSYQCYNHTGYVHHCVPFITSHLYKKERKKKKINNDNNNNINKQQIKYDLWDTMVYCIVCLICVLHNTNTFITGSGCLNPMVNQTYPKNLCFFFFISYGIFISFGFLFFWYASILFGCCWFAFYPTITDSC